MEDNQPETPRFVNPGATKATSEELKTESLPPPESPKEDKPKSKKKLITIIVLAVLVILGGVLAWYFLIRETKGAESNQGQNSNQQSADSSPVALGSIDTVPYAFRAGDAENYSIFWRSATGGDRTEVGPLAAKSYVSQREVSGQYVAYALENEFEGTAEAAVWLSTDGGRTYSKLLDLDDEDQVTSMVFSTDGSALAVAVVSTGEDSNTVTMLDTDSKTEIGSFTSSQRGIFLEGYDATQSQIIYFEGCYNCDGVSFDKIQIRDISEDSVRVLADAGELSFVHTEVRSDFSEVLVAKGTVAQDEMSSTFAIQKVSISDGSIKDVGTLEVGGGDDYITSLGYMADGKTPYYTRGNIVAVLRDDGSSSTLYQSEANIIDVFYVSNQVVIASSGEHSNFILNNYSVADGIATNILNGDANTRIFGVTTK